MRMIRKLKLENFKGIKNGELEFAPLTILLGANNSGKTTVLEALFLAPNPFRDVPYVIKGSIETAAGIVHSMHETLHSEGYAFLLNKYAYEDAKVECDVNGDKYLLGFIRDDPYIYVTTNRNIGGQTDIRGRKIWYIGRLNVSEAYPESVYSKELIDNTLLISSNLIKYGYRYLEKKWASIINLGICKRIAEQASDLSNERYRDLTIEPFLDGKLALYAYTEDGSRVRLGDLGEGIQSYMIARVLYEATNPKVLLWDDVEAHFNPLVLLKVSEWISDIVEDGRQVILTTHSLEAVKTIAGLNEESVKIYLTSLKDGIFKAKGLTLEEVEELGRAGVDVRAAEPLLL